MRVGFFLYLAVVCLLLASSVSGSQRHQQSRPERQATRDSWRQVCDASITKKAKCEMEKPVCCSRRSAVRCCTHPLLQNSSSTSAATSSSGILQALHITTEDVCASALCREELIKGYEFTIASLALIGFMTTLLLGTSVPLSCALGRYIALKVQRSQTISDYRQRRRENRAVAERYRAELANCTQELEAHQEGDAEADTSFIECIICFVRPVNVALGPCGHVALCEACCERLKVCPVCREEIKAIFTLPPTLVTRLMEMKNTERMSDVDVNEEQVEEMTSLA